MNLTARGKFVVGLLVSVSLFLIVWNLPTYLPWTGTAITLWKE